MKKQSCCQTAKEVFLKLDFFCTTQFLRYKSESEYSTLTGAICSVIIVITFLSIFMNVLIGTINRTQITYNMNTIDQSTNSLNLDTSIRGSNKFMFAVGVGGFNLNDPTQRFFDVSFTLISSINKVKSKVNVALEPCTIDKWNISADIVSTYNRMNFNQLLCAPENINISLQGKFSENIFNYAQLEVSKCNSSRDPTRPCANDTYILSQLSGKSFYTNFYFINSLINPNNENPISYYLEDRNYIQFNYQYGGLVNLFVSKYQITTDNSIWPLEDNRAYEGGYSNELGQFISFQHDGSTLAQFFLRRASTNVEVTRQYTKLDSTLSYIGGLFGFIMAALLFLSKYTECCYQIDAGAQLYNQDHLKEIDKDSFNLFWYLGYIAYQIFGLLGFKCQWQRMKEYDDCRQEMQKQLDVCFLFERLNFIERSLEVLFTEEQFKLLHLRKKSTISDAGQRRQYYLQLERLKQDTKQDFLRSQENVAENTFGQLLATQNSPSKPKSQNYSSEQQESPIFSGLKRGMKILKKSSLNGDAVSKKIVESIDTKIAVKIEECISESNQSEQLKPSLREEVSLDMSKQANEPQQAVESENIIRIEPKKQQQPFTFIE